MKVISFTNNKGGVGKSTSAVSVSAYFALKGFKTLLIDLDPQGNSTFHLYDKELVKRTMLNAFEDGDIEKTIVQTAVDNLDLIPANLTLDQANMSLMSRYRKEDLLKDLLVNISNQYDLCVVDTCPALNVLTYNALVASDSVYVPIRAGAYELEGMRNLLSVIRTIDKQANPGIFFTQSQSNHKITQIIKEQIENEFGENFGEIMNSSIRTNVTLNEAPILKQPIFLYAPTSNGAIDYEALCIEIANREEIPLKLKKTRKRKVTKKEEDK